MRYHTTGSLSEHLKSTPEGYLLCLDVAIARLGVQEYLPEEVPFPAEGRETVLVYRMESDVFAPETIASFEGKPVTLDHPDDFVTPESWRELSRGVAQNLRRGAGKDADLLLADLLITDVEAIAAVQDGLREVSCGYDADYEETAPGVGRQVNIIGNHVALVDRGRCGPRCKIKDATTEKKMKKIKKGSIFDRLFGNAKVRRALDEAAAEMEGKDEDTPPENKPVGDDDRFAALESKVDEILLALRGAAQGDEDPEPTGDDDPDNTGDDDPEPTGDEDPDETADEDPDAAADEDPKPTGDRRGRGKDKRSVRVADADTVRRAKIIAPRISARVGDSRCVLMRHALRNAMHDKAIAPAISSVLRGYTLDSADCVTLDAAFMTASEIAKRLHNKHTADGLARRSVKDFGKAITPADINKANQEHYARGTK